MFLFRREASLPVNLTFGISIDRTSATSHKDYLDWIPQNLKTVYEKAQPASDIQGKQNKCFSIMTYNHVTDCCWKTWVLMERKNCLTNGVHSHTLFVFICLTLLCIRFTKRGRQGLFMTWLIHPLPGELKCCSNPFLKWKMRMTGRKSWRQSSSGILIPL